MVIGDRERSNGWPGAGGVVPAVWCRCDGGCDDGADGGGGQGVERGGIASWWMRVPVGPDQGVPGGSGQLSRRSPVGWSARGPNGWDTPFRCDGRARHDAARVRRPDSSNPASPPRSIDPGAVPSSGSQLHVSHLQVVRRSSLGLHVTFHATRLSSLALVSVFSFRSSVSASGLAAQIPAFFTSHRSLFTSRLSFHVSVSSLTSHVFMRSKDIHPCTAPPATPGLRGPTAVRTVGPFPRRRPAPYRLPWLRTHTHPWRPLLPTPGP
jgi:hypothetical protein